MVMVYSTTDPVPLFQKHATLKSIPSKDFKSNEIKDEKYQGGPTRGQASRTYTR